MISVTEALNILKNTIPVATDIEIIKLSSAHGYVLSEDIVSKIDMPPFRQSAMDGYAINFNDQNVYEVIDEVKAGSQNEPDLEKGQAVRIFTGAPVPANASMVIMQEKVLRKENTINIEIPVTHGQNIRPKGEQVVSGQVALKKGCKLNSAGIGYLASLGIDSVSVYKKPKISIIVTGDELVQPGVALNYGQIYESNANMLSSALKGLGYAEISILKVSDNYQATYETLKKALKTNDLVLISGGISVGDYDFVGKALIDLGTEQHFYKIKQKPGKPLFYGLKNNTVVFALPGNPGSALSCFYIYVLEALNRLSGNSGFELNKVQAVSNSNFSKRGDRAQFLKANYSNGKVTILDGQNSSMLHTFALANAFVFLEEDQHTVKSNDLLQVILLPIT